MKFIWTTAILIFSTSFITNAYSNSSIKIGLFMDEFYHKPITTDTTVNGPNGPVIRILDYMRALGYTHVLFMLFQGDPMSYDKNTKTWKYNNGDYTGSVEANSFRNLKKLSEARGMKLVPGFGCLSHVDWYISQDSSISEFPGTTSWSNFCNSIPKTFPKNAAEINLIPANTQYNDIAFIGNYPKITNPGMDAIIHENLVFILKNWGNSVLGGKFPEFIMVSHDEIGNWGIPFVKNPRSVSGSLFPGGPSESTLLAREIAYRYKQIQEVFSPLRGTTAIKMMIYADCFSDEANGQVLHLSPTLSDLKKDSCARLMAPDISANLYVMPWAYDAVDNGGWKQNNNNSLNYDKRPILQNFTSLGFHTILCAGEWPGLDDPNYIPHEMQCTFEWARAAQQFPAYFSGFGNLHWTSFTATGKYGTAGFTDALLAYLEKYPYLAKSYPSDPVFPLQGAIYHVCPYYPGVFAGVDYAQVRKNLSWTEGTDYVTGLALRQVGPKAKLTSASWNLPTFIQYTLTGAPHGTIGGTSDNFLYAFAERNDNFDAQVRTSSIPTGFRTGIMLRNDLTVSSRNIHIYNDGSSTIKISHRDIASGATTTDPSMLSNATWIRIVRNNRNISCFASTDGTSWTKLGEYYFGKGTVLIGFTSSSTNGNTGAVVFSDLSIN
jgi:regulation of enolase protein 1 (concanavalin A-like superfamily)